MANINIKVENKDSVRKFNLPSHASWIELEAKLRTLFNIPALTPFTLSYTDEDNDVITLSTDIELQEIFSSSSTIKFNLKFSTTDDLSDTDYSDNDWVLEGARKGAASATTIETDNSVLQSNVSNVSHKNINSSTNQEPQDIESESDNDIIHETSNKKVQVDDDFEKLEKSPSNVESVEKLPNDVERLEKSPSNIESVENSPNDIERVEKSNDIERVEKSNDIESVEKSANDIERAENFIERIEKVVRGRPITGRSTGLFVETSTDDSDRLEKTNDPPESPDMLKDDSDRVEKTNDLPVSPVSPVSPILPILPKKSELFVEMSKDDSDRVEKTNDSGRSSPDLLVERSSDDSGRVEKSLNDVDRVEDSSNKKISRVNLLDDEFFESFNSFKISPTIVPFEPKPIPLPQSQPQREVENEQENLGDEDTIGTLLSNNFSPFSERIQPRQQEDQNSSDIEEELREVIGKYVKKDPQLAASVIDEIRSSIHVDYERRFEPFHRPTQSREDKRNYFRQRPITSPISGRSRSATPPRPPVHNNRSSTPDYNRSSGYNRSSARSSTPDNRDNRDNRSPSPMLDYRSSTPPSIPGSFPVPASTPCLWVNENDNEPPRPDPNTNRRGRRGRRGNYRYRSNNRNQRNAEQSTNVGEEILNREEIPVQIEQKEYQKYREEIELLNEMGLEKFEYRYVELLNRYNGNMDLVTEELTSLNK